MSCPFDELAGAKGASPTFIPAKLIAYQRQTIQDQSADDHLLGAGQRQPGRRA
jgi:hypothetical protein